MALEHYADFGRISHFEPLAAQQQLLFAVADYKCRLFALEFGVGHGFTAPLILKLILSHDF